MKIEARSGKKTSRDAPIKVLLVVPEFHLPIGILARYIAQPDPGIDFYFFSGSGIRLRTAEFINLTRHVDIVHFLSNLNSIHLPPGIDIRALPCPTVSTIHHVESDEDVKITEACRADVVQVIAEEWLAYVTPRSATPVHLAHQTVCMDIYQFSRKADRPRTPFRIGSFGMSESLQDRKRLDILLGALTLLQSMGESLELVVQGPGWGKLAPFFRERSIRVRNLGFESSKNLGRSYREIDAYVCTSDVEGGPLTVLEALAGGVPVISTPVAVAEEALHLGAGILVEKNNPGLVAEAIRRLMRDRDLYQRLRVEAPDAAQRFSWENISSEYVSLYTKAISTWEEKKHQCWESPEAISLSPGRQRGRELSLARFREAHSLKDHGRLSLCLQMVMQAVLNPDVLIREKISGLRYFAY